MKPALPLLSIALIAGSSGHMLATGGARHPVFEALFCAGWDCQDERLIERAFRRMWLGGDPLPGVEMFRETLRRNPASPYRWSDLGEAWFQAGNFEAALYCFARVDELGPAIPPILIRLANFHARMGHEQAMLSYYSRALHLAPQYFPVVEAAYRRMRIDSATILARGLPPDAHVAQPFFRSLLAAGNVPEIEKTWAWMYSHSLVDEALAHDYREFLLRNDAAGATGRD